MRDGRLVTAPGAERLRRNLIWLLFAGLAIRVIMPVGYMPAPIGDGGPFVLCPGAFFGASLLVDDGAAHAGHDQHADAAASAWESCPFGFAAGSPALTADISPTVHSPQQSAPASEAHTTTGSAVVGSYRARAPPGIQPLYA